VGLGKWVDEYPNEVIRRLYALAPKFYYLEFASKENEVEGSKDHHLLKSKGIQMTLTNRNRIHGQSLGNQLLELFFPRKNEVGQLQPFQGSIPMKNMLMGVNAISTNFEYGTMLTRYTEDKKLSPVISKRHLVYYTKADNVAYDKETALDEIHRIETIPKGYFRNIDDVANELYYYL
jgi:hypothetical protein